MAVIGTKKSLDRLPPFQYIASEGQTQPGGGLPGITPVKCFTDRNWSAQLPKGIGSSPDVPPVFWDKQSAKLTGIFSPDSDFYRDPPLPYRSKGSLMLKVPKAAILVWPGASAAEFGPLYTPDNGATNLPVLRYIDSQLGPALDKAGIFYGTVADRCASFLTCGLPSFGPASQTVPFHGFPVPAKLINATSFVGGEVYFFCATDVRAYFDGSFVLDATAVAFDAGQINTANKMFHRVAWHVMAGQPTQLGIPPDTLSPAFVAHTSPLLPVNYNLEVNNLVAADALGVHQSATYDFPLLTKIINDIKTFFSLT